MEVAGKPRDFHRRTGRRILREIARIDFVHGGEVVHVFEENTEFYGAVKRGAGGLHDGFQIFEYARGLFRSAAFNGLAGRWIKGNLAGDKDKSVGLDRLRVWADGLGP